MDCSCSAFGGPNTCAATKARLTLALSNIPRQPRVPSRRSRNAAKACSAVSTGCCSADLGGGFRRIAIGCGISGAGINDCSCTGTRACCCGRICERWAAFRALLITLEITPNATTMIQMTVPTSRCIVISPEAVLAAVDLENYRPFRRSNRACWYRPEGSSVCSNPSRRGCRS